MGLGSWRWQLKRIWVGEGMWSRGWVGRVGEGELEGYEGSG